MKVVVVGDTTLAQILPQLDASFGDWQVPKTVMPKKALATVEAQVKPRMFLIDRPDAVQSMILGGLVAPSSKSADYLALDVGNDAFGGSFTSRINMNLREDKHWAYGASSFAQDALGQRAFMFYAPVQTDKTAESVTEVQKEARAVIGDKPLTNAEIAKVKDNNVRSLPGSFETGQAVMTALTPSSVQPSMTRSDTQGAYGSHYACRSTRRWPESSSRTRSPGWWWGI
jgi:predicted Zn-dependent peptidase